MTDFYAGTCRTYRNNKQMPPVCYPGDQTKTVFGDFAESIWLRSYGPDKSPSDQKLRLIIIITQSLGAGSVQRPQPVDAVDRARRDGYAMKHSYLAFLPAMPRASHVYTLLLRLLFAQQLSHFIQKNSSPLLARLFDLPQQNVFTCMVPLVLEDILDDSIPISVCQPT